MNARKAGIKMHLNHTPKSVRPLPHVILSEELHIMKLKHAWPDCAAYSVGFSCYFHRDTPQWLYAKEVVNPERSSDAVIQRDN